MKLIDYPCDWQDLQNKVSIVLDVCGYIVETPKTIKGVRGEVEVDVFAYKEKVMSIICECKYWNSPIPQTVVHSFRTVVNDLGANLGIIITKTGYQRGAYNSIHCTNIELFTWEEFESKYKQDFLNGYYKKMEKGRKQLYKFSSFLKDDYDQYYYKLPAEKQKEVNSRQRYYETISLLSSPSIVTDDALDKFNINEEYLIQQMARIEKELNRIFDSYYDFFSTIEGLINTGNTYFTDVYNLEEQG